jgi:prephenate dehydrogenase
LQNGFYESQAMPIHRITILGTGLIGASVGLALRARGFPGEIAGWDRDPRQSEAAHARGAISTVAGDPIADALRSDLVLLSGPVLSILDWMDQLAPRLSPGQLVTDVGSVKLAIVERARTLFGGQGQAGFLPGHPMAGKEVSGAANAEEELFSNAVWLFTAFPEHPLASEWRAWVERFGCRTIEMEAARHDEVCAWLSHLPQMLSTALSALLAEKFSGSGEPRALGGRALREMTRLGASPYSMWRDIAHTNAGEIAQALLALEQELAFLRENLKTAELREEFDRANRFRDGFKSSS